MTIDQDWITRAADVFRARGYAEEDAVQAATSLYGDLLASYGSDEEVHKLDPVGEATRASVIAEQEEGHQAGGRTEAHVTPS